MKRAASAVQLPTTAGGAITNAGPSPRGREQVRQQRRRLAETHVECKAAAETGRVEEPEPGEGFGLVAAQLPTNPSGGWARLGLDPVGRGEEVGGPAAAFDR